MTTRHFVAIVPARTVTGTDLAAYYEAEKASRTHAERSRKMGAFKKTWDIPAQTWLRSSATQVYSSASPSDPAQDIQWHRAGGRKVGPYRVVEVTKATAEMIRACIHARKPNASAPSDSWAYTAFVDPTWVLAD